MALLLFAAKFDPLLSLDCAGVERGWGHNQMLPSGTLGNCTILTSSFQSQILPRRPTRVPFPLPLRYRSRGRRRRSKPRGTTTRPMSPRHQRRNQHNQKSPRAARRADPSPIKPRWGQSAGCRKTSRYVQSSDKKMVRGCESFLPALARLFFLAPPGSCIAKFAHFLAGLCTRIVFP